ncbi:CHAT domain-containing protein [Kribbella sp. NPDC049174]|uniref:CHAT domain-containing protein n=1 Tax=Kribbella sp. NPDC049174 TaxID=3364112 RepID=UPI00371E8DC5
MNNPQQLSRQVVVRRPCPRCERDTDHLAWRVLDAEERADLVQELGNALMPLCQTCGEARPLDSVVVVTRWCRSAPLIVVMPDEVVEFGVNLQTEVEEVTTEALESARSAGIDLPRHEVPVVPRVLRATSPQAVDNLVEERLRHGTLPEDHDLATFVQFIENSLINRVVDDAARDLMTATSLEELQALRSDDLWETQAFQRDLLEHVQRIQLPTPEANAALANLARAVANPQDLPDAWLRYQDAVRDLASDERLSELQRLATDAKAHPGARIAAANEGIALAAATMRRRGEALFSRTLAMILWQQHPSEPAFAEQILALLRRAISLCAELDDTASLLQFRGELGVLLGEVPGPDRLARRLEGVQVLREVIESAETMDDGAIAALNHSNLALALKGLRSLDPGLDISLEEILGHAETALAYRSAQGDRHNLAYSYNHRGVILLEIAIANEDADRALEAVADLAEAVRLCEQITDPGLRAASLADLATAELRTASLLSAPIDDPLWQSAERHAAMVADDPAVAPRFRAEANETLADVLTQIKPESADIARRLETAIQLSSAVDDPGRLRTIAQRLATILAQRGEWARAAHYFEQASDADNLAAEFSPDGPPDRPPAVTDPGAGPLGRWAAYSLAKAGDYRRAVEVLDASLCRHVGRERRTQIEILKVVERINPHLAQRFVDCRQALRGKPSFEIRQAIWNELTSVIGEIRRAGHPQFLRHQPLAVLARDFSGEHPLVYLLTSPSGTVGLVVTGDTPDEVMPIWADGLTSKTLAEWTFAPIGESLVTASSKDGFIASLERVLPSIGKELMGPLAAELRAIGASRVTLVPTGALSSWPLHAAPFGSGDPAGTASTRPPHCLWDAMPVDYLPSALYRLDKTSLDDRMRMSRTLVGLADPVSDMRPLPGSRLELRRAAELYQGDVQLAFGPDATGEFLLEHMQRPADVHLGCHATGVALERGGAVLHLSDGDFAVADLERAGRDLPIGLVVAAACHTGARDIEVELDESMNLQTAFLNAGATGAITSLWPVADAATGLLLREFYVCTQVDLLDPAAALQRAALWLRSLTVSEAAEHFKGMKFEDASRGDEPRLLLRLSRSGRYPFAHPYYWAGFTYTGTA